jgi:hypothetical protein
MYIYNMEESHFHEQRKWTSWSSVGIKNIISTGRSQEKLAKAFAQCSVNSFVLYDG